jgi:SAM-dependent methyltransferase
MPGGLPAARLVTARPEERRTAHEYNSWMREGTLHSIGMRLLMGKAGLYLVNTPVFAVPEEVGLQPNHRVLDLGCGRAGLGAMLARIAGLVHNPVGLDISTSMLALAGRDMESESPVDLVAGAATRLPFPDESFHLVLAAYLFKHLEDETLFRMLLEVQRVLKPGGILLGWEFAPTSSKTLNRFHEWLLSPRVKTCRLRGFGALAPYALYAGFRHVDRLHLKVPFLFPPIPRLVVMLQKATGGIAPAPDEICAAELWSWSDAARPA